MPSYVDEQDTVLTVSQEFSQILEAVFHRSVLGLCIFSLVSSALFWRSKDHSSSLSIVTSSCVFFPLFLLLLPPPSLLFLLSFFVLWVDCLPIGCTQGHRSLFFCLSLVERRIFIRSLRSCDQCLFFPDLLSGLVDFLLGFLYSICRNLLLEVFLKLC